MTGPSVDEQVVSADASSRRRPRRWWLYVTLLVVALIAAGGFVAARSVAPVSSSYGCCGATIPYGEVFYCVQPDTAHPAGGTYLLKTDQLTTQQGQRADWPDRVETGHVGTPLLWRQPAGDVALSLNYDPSGPNDTTVDTTQSATVREGAVTPVVVAGGAGATTACPAPPTAVSTPQG